MRSGDADAGFISQQFTEKLDVRQLRNAELLRDQSFWIVCRYRRAEDHEIRRLGNIR